MCGTGELCEPQLKRLNDESQLQQPVTCATRLHQGHNEVRAGVSVLRDRQLSSWIMKMQLCYEPISSGTYLMRTGQLDVAVLKATLRTRCCRSSAVMTV